MVMLSGADDSARCLRVLHMDHCEHQIQHTRVSSVFLLSVCSQTEHLCLRLAGVRFVSVRSERHPAGSIFSCRLKNVFRGQKLLDHEGKPAESHQVTTTRNSCFLSYKSVFYLKTELRLNEFLSPVSQKSHDPGKLPVIPPEQHFLSHFPS